MRRLAKRVNEIPTGLGSTARDVLALMAEHADEEGVGRIPMRNLRYGSKLSNTRFNEQVEVLKEDGWIKIESLFGEYQIDLSRIEPGERK